MPPPNKSQSPPNPRSSPSLGLDACLSLDFKSMRTTKPLLSNASIRRIGSSRRARPVATSLADVFVRSLVIAGYCPEHSPRGRGIGTVPVKSLKQDIGKKWGGTGLVRASKHRPNYLGSPVECLGIRHSKTQRMFNSSIAQRVEVYDTEDDRTECLSAKKPEHKTKDEDVTKNHVGELEEDLEMIPYKRTALDIVASRNNKQTDLTTRAAGCDEIDQPWEVERYSHYKSPARKLYHYTSKIYQAALGDSLDWKEAADTVATPRPFQPQDDFTKTAVDLNSVRRFVQALWDRKKSNHHIFGLYRDLPSPGMAHLSKRSRGALLRRFAQPRDRRWVDARRYLALIEDMLAAGLPVSRALWSTAIHLAGRAGGKVCKQDLVRAIGLWQQMEHLAGIESDGVVFTILFDIAIKAGQYTVADRLMEEMERRNIQFGRAGMVSRIYYYGLLKDANGIRRSFDEFVIAGEIVDTAVLNCLMASFLRAGETETAEQMYHRMVQTQALGQSSLDPCHEPAHPAGPGLISELIHYRRRSRRLSRVLQLSASLKNILPEHHRALQEALPMAPDTRTFHIFLSHHAYKTGNLDAFTSVLGDMERSFAIPPRGMIYLLLFDGFAHNGRNKKGWTADKLWMAWRAYLRALYDSKTRLNRRSYSQSDTLVWENPFGGSSDSHSSKPAHLLIVPSGNLYKPLPSLINNVKDESAENRGQKHGHSSEEEEDLAIDEYDERVSDLDGNIDVDGLFSQGPQHLHSKEDELEHLERRIENGVFLGRRMIIIILRAFGTCCGPEDVMEVWLRMESIWQPERRKGLDVLAVKEELEYQMNRARKLH